ncbi:TPA: hypothetical protein DDZ06_04880 [Candidatus Uhrbacteria bacterium]|nr:hypothetical protein [Candidatus Uhrbacteria bacterium]
MSLFRPTSEFFSSAAPAEAEVRRTSEILGEAILSSVTSVRDSLPEQHRAHFETLRQEIIDFIKAHGISRESLGKPDLLREVTGKLSIQDLERLALLFERFEYLLKHKEPKEVTDPLEYAEEFYHLREQYDSQVSLLEQVGVLKEGAITGIDGKIYPIPTLEQIAMRLFERRETLRTKHDQGFTKLLLVPFGMSLDSLQETLEQFLLKYKKDNPNFHLNTRVPLRVFGNMYKDVDAGGIQNLVYHPQSFDQINHHGKTKIQILEEQEIARDFSPGWRVHLFQPARPEDTKSEGFAIIPKWNQGKVYGKEFPRRDLEAGEFTPNACLYFLKQVNRRQKDSPYYGESGLIPEDWIIAFMTHVSETDEPLDDSYDQKTSGTFLIGCFSPFQMKIPGADWNGEFSSVHLGGNDRAFLSSSVGLRTSVVV